MADTALATDPVALKLDNFAYGRVCDLEDPLNKIYDLLTAIMQAAQAIAEGDGISRIAEVARDDCAAVKEVRDELFHALHPNKGARA